jgi:hypothetical protein
VSGSFSFEGEDATLTVYGPLSHSSRCEAAVGVEDRTPGPRGGRTSFGARSSKHRWELQAKGGSTTAVRWPTRPPDRGWSCAAAGSSVGGLWPAAGDLGLVQVSPRVSMSAQRPVGRSTNRPASSPARRAVASSVVWLKGPRTRCRRRVGPLPGPRSVGAAEPMTRALCRLPRVGRNGTWWLIVKLWIAADGQRVERAGWARGGDLSQLGRIRGACRLGVGPADLADAWLVVAEQWGHKLASAVRARLVVVTEIGAEHRFEVTARVDERCLL